VVLAEVLVVAGGAEGELEYARELLQVAAVEDGVALAAGEHVEEDGDVVRVVPAALQPEDLPHRQLLQEVHLAFQVRRGGRAQAVRAQAPRQHERVLHGRHLARNGRNPATPVLSLMVGEHSAAALTVGMPFTVIVDVRFLDPALHHLGFFVDVVVHQEVRGQPDREIQPFALDDAAVQLFQEEHGVAEAAGRPLPGGQHHDPADQAPLDLAGVVVRVVVEGPRPPHLVRHVVQVREGLAGADGVGADAVVVRRPERPRTVGVDAVAQPVEVEGVRHVVGVPHVDLQPLARTGVDHGAGDAMVERGLVDVGEDQLVRLRDQVAGIQVLAVDHGGERAGLDFGLGDQPVLVSLEAHAVASVLDVGRGLFRVGAHGAVVGHPLDLEVDVPGHAGRLHRAARNLERELRQWLAHVPADRRLRAQEQLAGVVDAEVQVRPVVVQLQAQQLVEGDLEHALVARRRPAEEVVGPAVGVPRFDTCP
jgi:hypothetical protein